MSLLGRSSLVAFAFVVVTIAGCSNSHTADTDGGPHGGCTDGSAPLACVTTCGSDGLVASICVMDAWVCPPGTIDISTCPPTCLGAPPPGCRCEGTTWVCDETCPIGINPWDPTSPQSLCEPEGRHCQSGSTTDQCSSFLSCDCEGGHWNCLFAEPDPACWCGRQPDVGSGCRDEGTSCGECCPTPGGTGWPAMTCEGGRWQHAACPDIDCPPIDWMGCPVDRAAALGTACAIDGAACGNACCGRGFICSGGVWVEGPDVDCVTCDETATYECGPGTCERGQACTSHCGPDDGVVYTCMPMDSGCSSCDCTPIPPGSTCEERDGFVFVREDGFCG